MTNISKLASKIKKLYFVAPYYALQNKEGSYFPARNNGSQGSDIHITSNTIALSLSGTISIGAYSTSRDNKCKWICADVDEPILAKSKFDIHAVESLKEKTLIVYNRCLELGIAPHIESSGNKGNHVLVFFENEIPSEIAYKIAAYLGKDLPHIDCYPKQASLEGLKYGNLVRICHNLNLKTKNKSQWIDADFNPILDQYGYTMNIAPISEKEATRISDLLPTPYKKNNVIIMAKNSHVDTKVLDIPIEYGQRNLKQWIFIRRCIENNYSKATTIDLGKQWLEKNRDNYKTNYDTAVRYFIRCASREYYMEGLD